MKKLFKFFSIIIICLIIFVLCVYFIATNSFFIKNVFFPLAGSIMNAEIKAEKIVLSPFAGDFKVKNLEVKSTDGYSLKIGEYNSNINLFSMFKGVIKINHLNLKNTDIHIIQEINLEKKNNSQKIEPYVLHKESRDISDFVILDINKIKIENLNIIYNVKRSTEKESSVIELANFNVSIPKLKTGTDGTIDYNGLFKAGPENGKNKLTGELSGKIYTKISENSLPTFIKLNTNTKFGEEITPIEIIFESTRNKKLQKFPFKGNVKITNFPLLPLFKAFVDGSFSDATGKVGELSLEISGSDLIDPDIYSDVNVEFRTDIEELSLPIQLSEYKPLRVVFLPVEILSNINKYTKSNIVPSSLENVFNSANDISSGLNKMHFKKSNIYITLNKGMIEFKKLEMTGGTISAVRSISVEGYVDLNNQMNISTKTSFLGVIIPLNIKGTIDNPVPDLTMLLPGMVLGTTTNILQTGVGITKEITKGGMNIGNSLGSILEKSVEDSSKK